MTNLNGKISVGTDKESGKPYVKYVIEDMEEPITKEVLRKIKSELGEYTLITNAGVELHSSELIGGVWNGITIKRYKTN